MSPLHRAWLLAGLRRYTVPVLLLAYLAAALLGALVFGDIPQPQIPPDGYEIHTPEVRLSWHGRGHRGTYRLEVIAEGGAFDSPLVSKELRSSMHSLNDLERGKTYYWRVIEEGSGRTSRVASFRLSPQRIRY